MNILHICNKINAIVQFNQRIYQSPKYDDKYNFFIIFYFATENPSGEIKN